MKKFNKFIGAVLLSLAIISCEEKEIYPEITSSDNEVTLNTNGLDFSKYVSVGASFTAGYTDAALFKAGQYNSFPNILSKKFALAGGGEFTQPMMNDNIGGLLIGGNPFPGQGPRLYFYSDTNPNDPDYTGPMVLGMDPNENDFTPETPTTEVTTKVTTTGNFGVPGAKSFHLVAPGYGSLTALAQRRANPYYVRFASSPTATVVGDAVAQSPTFFTLSEVGGNDVLSYALAGGSGVNQTGNTNPATYGDADITDPAVFAGAFSNIVNALTANGAKGVVGTVPYITSLAHFTTVPHNPLDPVKKPNFAAQVPTLNRVFGMLNQVYTALGQTNRIVQFSSTENSAVVIKDESLSDLSAQITGALLASGPAFNAFLTQFGLPPQTAPQVAGLLGQFYGQTRQATASDLLVLTSSRVIGEIDTNAVEYLESLNFPEALAKQFSVEGITKPLEDKWVLTPQEQAEIKTATDAYNTTITSIADAKGLALVDLNAILETASTTGIEFDGYVMNTSLVTGGLISLDGIHLTARGYALMANEILKAIDAKYGSNFSEATNGLAKAADYPTNYSSSLR